MHTYIPALRHHIYALTQSLCLQVTSLQPDNVCKIFEYIQCFAHLDVCVCVCIIGLYVSIALTQSLYLQVTSLQPDNVCKIFEYIQCLEHLDVCVCVYYRSVCEYCTDSKPVSSSNVPPA